MGSQGLGFFLKNRKTAKIIELFGLFLLMGLVIITFKPLAGSNILFYQALLWTANVMALIYVWIGLRLRGETWEHFGLSFKNITTRGILKILGLSVIVFIIAVIAFLIGAVIMANISGIPTKADMSGYDFLKGNLPMLLLVLAGVYIVSSFGEEVIYRAFLINRISELGGNKRLARNLAVLISAIVFGLVHFDWGITGVVQTGFMGLALGISYVKLNKNLWIVISAHLYMDTILILQMYFAT